LTPGTYAGTISLTSLGGNSPFLIPVTLMLHKFWTVTDPMMAQIQMILFMKNVSMLGGALLISHFGAGPFSLDARREH